MDILRRYLAEEVSKRILSVKSVVVAINALFLIWSLALVIIGAYFQLCVVDGYSLLARNLSWPTSVAIAFGILQFCIALLGISSIHHRSMYLLNPYIITLSISLFVESTFLITGFVLTPRAFRSVIDSLRVTQSIYSRDHKAFTTWNSIQQNFKCCGVEYYLEWLKYSSNLSIPDSCCVFYSVDCGRVALKTLVFYKDGCVFEIHRWVLMQGIAAAILVIISILLKILALVFSLHYLQLLKDYAASMCRHHARSQSLLRTE